MSVPLLFPTVLKYLVTSTGPSRRALLVAMLAALLATIGLSNPCDASALRPAATASGNGWTTSASADAVSPGGTAALQVQVTSASSRSALVDVEVYGPSGRVFQQVADEQAFTAGARRTMVVLWHIPAGQAAGSLIVKIGIFAPGWAGLQHWNDAAATFAVNGSAVATTRPTTTTTRPTTTTTRPTTTTTRPTTTTTRPTTTTTRPTTTTTRPTTTTTRPTTTTAPAAVRFGTLPVGAALPSEATCAALVRRTTEIKPANARFNATKGASQQPQTGLFARVSGNFTGTTDEIIQWAACKWGIDEDIVRAQAAKESWWDQNAGGDWTTDSSRCATNHGIGMDGRPGQCPESVGLMQVRYPYWGSAFPSASTSSAYNLDIALAARRNCFEGNDGWLNGVERGSQYAAGDLWGCVGTWFSGRWYAGGAQEYISSVQAYLGQRIWETPGFRG